jgi:hypothetical protein
MLSETAMKSIKTPVRELIHHDVMDTVWCGDVVNNMTWWKIYKTIDVADIVNPLIIGVDDAIRITQTKSN